jgi:hypothetical protein
MARETDAA